MVMRSTWARYLAVHLLLTLVAVVAALLVGEVAVRILQSPARQQAAHGIQFEDYKKIYSDEPDTAYVYGHKPNARVTLTHGYYHYTFISNARGLRATRDYGTLPSSVVFLGDSVVEGASVENDETMSAVFERVTGITSLNFGLASANTVHEYYWLKAKYDPSYHAKLIVLGFCLNDFEQNTYLRRFNPVLGNWELYKRLDEPDPSSRPPSLVERLRLTMRHSALASFLYTRASERASVPSWSARRVNDVQRAFTERYIQLIKEFSRSIGASLVVVLFPTRTQLDTPYVGGDRIQDATIGLLNRLSVPYIDLHEPMRNQYLREPETRWFWDEVHPYKEGHRFIGEYLAVELPRRVSGLGVPAEVPPRTSESK